jgi:ABC-type hemin transport system ATPase subunit
VLILSEEQRATLNLITRSGDLKLVVGYAGPGKSTMWGVALSGIAAESLEGANRRLLDTARSSTHPRLRALIFGLILQDWHNEPAGDQGGFSPVPGPGDAKDGVGV